MDYPIIIFRSEYKFKIRLCCIFNGCNLNDGFIYYFTLICLLQARLLESRLVATSLRVVLIIQSHYHKTHKYSISSRKFITARRNIINRMLAMSMIILLVMSLDVVVTMRMILLLSPSLSSSMNEGKVIMLMLLLVLFLLLLLFHPLLISSVLMRLPRFNANLCRYYW